MSEDNIPYRYREDGTIDLVELFNDRFAQEDDANLFDADAIRAGRRMLVALEARKPIISRQAAEVAVILAEQVVVMHSIFSDIGQRLKRKGI